MKIKCLIVDDEAVSRKALKYFVDQTSFLSFEREAESAIEAVKILEEEPIDMILLDVNMPNMSGFDLLDHIDNSKEVIIISAEKEHALKAFDHQVTDYLVKPLQYSRFLKAVEKVRSKLDIKKGKNQGVANVFIKDRCRRIRISISEILFVEALADYVIIHTNSNKYVLHYTMKGIAKQLPEESFVRVHRSYIVNIDQIEAVEDLKIKLKDKEIPIGVSFRGRFFSKLHML